ncbi:FUSC family protein [Oligella ureolytica]
MHLMLDFLGVHNVQIATDYFFSFCLCLGVRLGVGLSFGLLVAFVVLFGFVYDFAFVVGVLCGAIGMPTVAHASAFSLNVRSVALVVCCVLSFVITLLVHLLRISWLIPSFVVSFFALLASLGRLSRLIGYADLLVILTSHFDVQPLHEAFLRGDFT